jgi:hypothetical protein
MHNIARRVRAAFLAFTRGDAQVRYVVANRAERSAALRKYEETHARLRREVTERDLVAAVDRARALGVGR